jgi:archaellum biogenesis protein FlaJ (TadC family)
MHTVMSFILVFVLEIIMNFNQKLSDVVTGQDISVNATLKVPDNLTAPPGISIPQSQDLSAGLDVFQMTNMASLQYTIILAIAILTLANALAPKFSEGGHNLKILTYLSITSITSGAILLIVPKVTASLLSM